MGRPDDYSKYTKECIDNIWYARIDLKLHKLYWRESKRRNKISYRELVIKKNCLCCGKEFLAQPCRAYKKYCSIKCVGVVNGVLNKARRIKIPGDDCPKQIRKCNRYVEYRIKYYEISIPKECPNCGLRKNISAHHPNYYKPDEIQWLCYSCHQRVHFGDKTIKSLVIII